MSIKFKGLVFVLIGLIAAVLILASMENFPGSKLLYFLFSCSYFLMLITALHRRSHFGYIFLVSILWLGFWAKLTAHLILEYPYREPIGQFDGSPKAWNEVLWVAIVASLGVMLGRLVSAIFSKTYSRNICFEQAMVPAWYPALRGWIWLFSLTSIIVLTAINSLLGVQQIGLAPHTVLPWPMNALIAWQVTLGGSLLLTVLLWWEVLLRKNIVASVYALVFEASLSSISILSRGLYLFHIVPQLFGLFENRASLVQVSKLRIIALIATMGFLLLFNIATVTTLRNHLYSDSQTKCFTIKEFNPANCLDEFSDFEYQISFGALNVFLTLLVDRWIGLEGVMATVGHPEKNFALLKKAALEKHEPGNVTQFQIISNSHYQRIDFSKVRFASLPGAAAFFFFMGSIWVVLVGMALVVIVLQLSEQLVFRLTKNPLLSSLIGFTLAHFISQLGVAPRENIPFFGMIICFILCVHALHSGTIYRIFRTIQGACIGRRTP